MTPGQESLGMAELEALRSIAESTKATATMISAQSMELRGLTKKLDDVHARLIRLEEQRHGHDIQQLTRSKETLEQRIATLELSHASMLGKFQGAGTLASVVKTYFPLIALAVVAFMYLAGFEIGKKP